MKANTPGTISISTGMSTEPTPLVGAITAGEFTEADDERDAEVIIERLRQVLRDLAATCPSRDVTSYFFDNVSDLPVLSTAAQTLHGAAVFGNAIFGQAVAPLHPRGVERGPKDVETGSACYDAFTAVRTILPCPTSANAALVALALAAHREYGTTREEIIP